MRLVIRELTAAPSLLGLHRQFPDRWPFLLASSASAGQLGRWSMLLRADPDQAASLAYGDCSDFLDRLQADLNRKRVAAQSGALPFCGGWFVYLGYELAAEIEPGLELPPAEDGLPVALARRCRSAVLDDQLTGQRWL